MSDPRQTNQLTGEHFEDQGFDRGFEIEEPEQPESEVSTEDLGDQVENTWERAKSYWDSRLLEGFNEEQEFLGRTSRERKSRAQEIIDALHSSPESEETEDDLVAELSELMIEQAFADLAYARQQQQELSSKLDSLVTTLRRNSADKTTIQESTTLATELYSSILKLEVYLKSTQNLMKDYEREFPDVFRPFMFSVSEAYASEASRNMELSQDNYDYYAMFDNEMRAVCQADKYQDILTTLQELQAAQENADGSDQAQPAVAAKLEQVSTNLQQEPDAQGLTEAETVELAESDDSLATENSVSETASELPAPEQTESSPA